jgi:hypothetical protein
MNIPEHNAFNKLLAFLDHLEEAKIPYRLEHIRDSVMISLAVPGQRWEIEFFDDGHTEIERFISQGTIESEDILDSLFTMMEYSDPPDDPGSTFDEYQQTEQTFVTAHNE